MRSAVLTTAQFLACVFITGCGDDLGPSKFKLTEPASIFLNRDDEAGMKADELEHHERFRKYIEEHDETEFLMPPEFRDDDVRVNTRQIALLLVNQSNHAWTNLPRNAALDKLG